MALLRERYELNDKLAEREFAQVYRAYDRRMQREVAIWQLNPTLVAKQSDVLADRLLRLARLRHPHIERVFDYDLDGAEPYLATELGLYMLLLDAEWALRDMLFSMAGAADALAVLHDQGLVHGRLHTGTLMIKGLSYESAVSALHLMIVGVGIQDGLDDTPERAPYRAPEQWLGQQVDGRTDVYALGVLLYALTTGQLPFEGPTIRADHLGSVPIPPRVLKPDLPLEIDALIQQALAKAPEERFGSAHEMAAILRDVAAGLEVEEIVFSDELLIEQVNAEVRNVALTDDRLTIGSAETADIIIRSNDIVAQHVLLERQLGAWFVTDLGSELGTQLDGKRLLAHSGERWHVQQLLRIGNVALRWRKQDDGVVPGVDVTRFVRVDISTEHLQTSPGESAEFQVALHNDSQQIVHCNLQLSGVPPNWVRQSDETTQLMPKTIKNFQFTIAPPASSSALAGDYPLTLRLMVQREKLAHEIGQVVLTVAEWRNWSATLQPEQMLQAGNSYLTLTNSGNVPLTGKLSARDESNRLKFLVSQTAVPLAPGTSEMVAIDVRSKHQPWIGGGREIVAFEVEAVADDGEPALARGSLEIRPKLAGWMLVSAFGMLISLLLTSVYIGSIFWERRIDTQNTIDIAVTQRAMRVTLTAAAVEVIQAGTIEVTVPPIEPTAIPTLTPRADGN